MMGKRAKSDDRHLLVLCEFHHRGMKAGHNWEASHREQQRAYLGLDPHG